MKFCEVGDISGSGKIFSRETGSLGAINGRLYPRLLKNRGHGAPVRFWVRNCARNYGPGALAAEHSRQVYRAKPVQPELFDVRDRQLPERSRLRLAALVHDYADAVLIRDFKGRILAWNKGAERMYGYTEEEALGMNVRRLIPKKTPGRSREVIRLSARGQGPAPVETRRRAKDGRALDVLVTVTVLKDERGFPAEVATIERDITEQKRVERELRRLHARVISAQETERKRLARELHDGVGQTLSGVKFRMESLPGEIALDGRAAAKMLELGGLLDRAISEIRRVSKNLMPSELEDLGLEPALRTLCREFKGRDGVNVALHTGRVRKAVAPELGLALFRITQEALNNIGKHSEGTMAAVDLSRQGREIVLRVSDNGIGFAHGDRRGLKGRGIGLASMRERAESVGGSIELRSIPGAGTTLCVRAPLAGLEGGSK